MSRFFDEGEFTFIEDFSFPPGIARAKIPPVAGYTHLVHCQLMRFSWRLVKLLQSRQGGNESLQIEPWPVDCQCIVLKRFVRNGRSYEPVSSTYTPSMRGRQPAVIDPRPRGTPADIIELPPAEARTMLGQGLIDPRPRADRFKVSYAGASESWPGWVPWHPPKIVGEMNFFRGPPDDSFDQVLVRVKLLTSAVSIAPGLVMQPGEIIYLPFVYARVIGSFYSQDEAPRDASFLLFLDEFISAAMPRPQMTDIMKL
jgi:hypothetical protein